VVGVVLVSDTPVTVVAVAVSIPVAVPTLVLVVVGVAAAALPSVMQGPVLVVPPALPVTVEVIVKW
jgi:hypothetical protein